MEIVVVFIKKLSSSGFTFNQSIFDKTIWNGFNHNHLHNFILNSALVDFEKMKIQSSPVCTTLYVILLQLCTRASKMTNTCELHFFMIQAIYLTLFSNNPLL